MLKRKSKKTSCRLERSQTLGGRPACPHSLAPELPVNFAERLLQLELELETNCCLPVVTSLMELYQQAIEYYEHKGDCKYLDLQTRMHKTLLRQDILSILSKESHAIHDPPAPKTPGRPLVASATEMPEIPATLSAAKTQEMIRKKKEDLSRAIRPQATELLRSDLGAVTVQVTRSLNHMFESHETSCKSTAQLVQKDKERQEEKLRSRLSARLNSRKNSRKNSPGRQPIDLDALSLRLIDSPYGSFPSSRVWSAQLSPREGSTTGSSSDTSEMRVQNFDELEKKLEELMERSYSEKAEKVAEVRKKYEDEIQELQREPVSGFMLQVLEQTKLNMQKELEETSNQCDHLRKEEVQQLRLQFH